MNPFKKLIPIFAAFVFAAGIAEGNAVSAAQINEQVKEAQEGVYAVQLVYTDSGSSDSFPIQSGSAFFINDDTLLTCEHVVEMDSEIEEAVEELAKAYYGSYSKNNISIEILLQSDISVKASVLVSSPESDWAALRISEKIKCETLTFGFSDECENTQNVYAIGYPSSVANYESVKGFSRSDISTTNGMISKITSSNDIVKIQHGATLSEGASGGPLVDADGAVVGINSSKVVDEDYYFAIAAEQILDVLEQKNISFTRYGEESAAEDEGDQPEESETVTADKSELSAVLSSAKNIDTSSYTEESAENLKKAISDAELVMNNGSASQNEVEEAVSELDGAVESLVNADDRDGANLKTILLIAAVSVFVILVIIILILVFAGKRKAASPAGAFPSDIKAAPTLAAVYTLLRLKNGDRAVIDKINFVAGKDRSCDYFIEGNSSISRSHAKFVLRGSDCFITDMRSTNGTYVNNVRVSPNSEVKLRTGDVIKLSDEEFEFRE